MAAPNLSTCEPWATIADVPPPCNTYDFDPVALEDALIVASDVLYNLTGRQWPGECETTARPCGYRRADSCGCLDSRSCGCTRPSVLTLPGPVISIEQVKIDGEILDPARYRIDDYRHLTYLPGDDSRRGWPCCQRLDLPDTEEDTWSVTWVYGGGPPPGGIAAAASLGCQLALSRDPELAGRCRLPKRVSSITRQSVSIAVIDPLTLFKDGLTGLSEVDLWVSSVMVGARRRRAVAWRPDLPAHGLRKPTG